MLNSIIKFALNHRSIVFLTSVILVFFGLRSASQLSIDVLPDVTRPRVAVLTEIPGFATEDVERLVTQEIELALNGAIGVEAIRSSSDQGLSVIQVEFDWGYDVFRARQIVQERLSIIKNRLPAWAEPRLAPNSTLLGQIMMIGVWSENGNTSPLDLRTIADWTLRRRLIQVEGVAQVLNIGGGKQQFQVLLDPHALHQFDIPINHVTEAIKRSNLNVAAGYVEKSAKELVVRGLGRIRTIEEIEKIVVKPQSPRSVLVED
ncbi:MAG: efflux RND transporter permease subunit, partial [Planctomycetota bacterium]|nr:efflux RND transporter permease subunit [Planctomycetota bacterium]